MLRCLNEQVASLEQQLAARFAAHPDAVIVRSLPGLGVVLGARVLGEFGDAPARYHTAKGRKAFAGTGGHDDRGEDRQINGDVDDQPDPDQRRSVDPDRFDEDDLEQGAQGQGSA
jgi:transposase